MQFSKKFYIEILGTFFITKSLNSTQNNALNLEFRFVQKSSKNFIYISSRRPLSQSRRNTRT